VERVDVDALEQLLAARDRNDCRAEIAVEPAAQLDSQADRLEREHGHQLPPVACRQRRHHEQADWPLDLLDRCELLVGEREP
jgi:hypothetical protein